MATANAIPIIRARECSKILSLGAAKARLLRGSELPTSLHSRPCQGKKKLAAARHTHRMHYKCSGGGQKTWMLTK